MRLITSSICGFVIDGIVIKHFDLMYATTPLAVALNKNEFTLAQMNQMLNTKEILFLNRRKES